MTQANDARNHSPGGLRERGENHDARLTVAFAKGRLLEEAVHALGIDEAILSTRQLAWKDPAGRFVALLLRPADVPVYVERGIADVGIVGKDVLEEADAWAFEVADLGFGACRLIVAGPPGLQLDRVRVVATKYPRSAATWFAERGMQVDIVRLHGSVELAPTVGLADCIVDIVQTGRTLAANKLVIFAHIRSVSARLIANPRSFHLRRAQIDAFARRQLWSVPASGAATRVGREVSP
ncbi:MAG: ATP phosphoribosyltransferase [Firmicutes bacterium]|nr:ATP phosphoribosyltransferase [Bacillota bacterium]